MIERESKSGEPDSQSTGHGNHAEHHASSGSVEIAAKKEKHNCLLVILTIKSYPTFELDIFTLSL